MPTCIECAENKAADAYYAHPQMASGHVNVCKDCHKRRMRIRSRTNPAVQEYDRARAKTPERKAKVKAYLKSYNEQFPLAVRARGLVNKAVRSGKLVKQPCEFCARADVHAHHRDYSKPLEVIWLCPKCHHRLHALFPETEGKMKAEAS
jgi:hypothetical protein